MKTQLVLPVCMYPSAWDYTGKTSTEDYTGNTPTEKFITPQLKLKRVRGALRCILLEKDDTHFQAALNFLSKELLWWKRNLVFYKAHLPVPTKIHEPEFVSTSVIGQAVGFGLACLSQCNNSKAKDVAKFILEATIFKSGSTPITAHPTMRMNLAKIIDSHRPVVENLKHQARHVVHAL